MINTKIYIVCENSKSVHVQACEIPTANMTGFFGTVELKFQRGQATTVSVPRETLFLETISKDDWEKTFGEIKDDIERI